MSRCGASPIWFRPQTEVRVARAHHTRTHLSLGVPAGHMHVGESWHPYVMVVAAVGLVSLVVCRGAARAVRRAKTGGRISAAGRCRRPDYSAQRS